MADARVTIDEIVLRVPNLSEDDARRLGRDVAERVGDALALMVEDAPGAIDLGGLDLRLTLKDMTSRDDLARAIAERILASLRPAIYHRVSR